MSMTDVWFAFGFQFQSLETSLATIINGRRRLLLLSTLCVTTVGEEHTKMFVV